MTMQYEKGSVPMDMQHQLLRAAARDVAKRLREQADQLRKQADAIEAQAMRLEDEAG